MAPPPPSNLPLGERLKALAQTLQYVICPLLLEILLLASLREL